MLIIFGIKSYFLSFFKKKISFKNKCESLGRKDFFTILLDIKTAIEKFKYYQLISNNMSLL